MAQKYVENLNLVFQVKQKFGSLVTKESLIYFTKAKLKHLKEQGYIEFEKHTILDNNNNTVVDNIDCIRFTDKTDKAMRRQGYTKLYYSNSDSHDLALNYNATKFAKEFQCDIGSYRSEQQLEDSRYGYSKPDGIFTVFPPDSDGDFDKCIIVAIEQTTENYTKEMKAEKSDYCKEFGFDLTFF